MNTQPDTPDDAAHPDGLGGTDLPILELDCRDMLCPMPVIELARHIDRVDVGSVIAVVTRDLAARIDVPAWCRMRGQEYLGEKTTTDQVPRHLVRRVR